MPPTKINKKNIKNLFSNFKKETANFININPVILMENPKYILLLRLMLKLSQIEFAKKLKISDTNLSKYELGKIKNMRHSTAESYIKIFLDNIKEIPSENEIVKTFEKFKEESNGWFKFNKDTKKALFAMRKGAANSLIRQKTKQEEMISNFLKNKNIDHHLNYLFDNERGIIVDIFIKNRIPIVIECKDLKTKIRREVRDQVQRLAYQGYRIKFHHKNCLLIALIKSKLINSRDINELNQPFDKVFINNHDFLNYFTDLKFSR